MRRDRHTDEAEVTVNAHAEPFHARLLVSGSPVGGPSMMDTVGNAIVASGEG